MPTASQELRKKANKAYAKQAQGFFKTSKGEYGYGDVFLGVRVPEIRKIAKKYRELETPQVVKLVESKYHEERMLGLIILMNQYERAKDEKEQDKIYKLYVSKFPFINNWDLVDVTCPRVVGAHLIERDRKVLYKWAKSKDLWTRRMAMISQWWFIRKGDLSEIFKIAEVLVHDEHDLIHKAVGWMIREAAKKDMKKAESFLKKHYKTMPRTMLRYAIERFPEKKRQAYLKGAV
jgi:3-methyladenine DNA glycosylase AlkD